MTAPATLASDTAGQRIQRVTTAGVAGLAAGAFLLSYDALHQLARTSHVPALLAWLWPLIVDGFIIVASLAVLQAVHTGRRPHYPWLLVLGFSALSVTFNILHAPNNLVAQLVAAIPPLALVLSFELLMRQIHHSLHTAPVPVTKTRNQLHETHRERPPAEVSAPATVAPPPPPTRPVTTRQPNQSGKATRSPRAVTLARARDVQAELEATGQQLSTAILADRLAVSPGYARRLLRELNDAERPAPAALLGSDASTQPPGLRAVGP